MSAPLTGSGLARARHCPDAYALEASPLQAESGAARRGTAIHGYLEALLSGVPRDVALADVPEDAHTTCAGIDPRGLPAALAEIPLAFDVATATARVLEKRGHRDYGDLGPTELAFTLDFAVSPALREGVPLVGDWKTGYESVPDAQGCDQLELAALAVRALGGASMVDLAVVRIDGVGGLHWDMVRYDGPALDAALAKLRRTVRGVAAARAARARGEAPAVVPGAHCKWCPAQGSCPAFGAQARHLAALSLDWLAQIQVQLATPEGAAYWWETTKRAGAVLEAVEASLRARLDLGAVDLPDGRSVRRVRERYRRLDGRKALTVLRELVGPAAAEAACEVKASPASIREACGALAPRVLDALREGGAYTEFYRETTRVGMAR